MSQQQGTGLEERAPRKPPAEAAPPRTPARPEPGEAAPGPDAAVEVQNARFQALQPRPASPAGDNLGRLLDVVVSVSLELGRTQMPLRNVLELGTGSVVKLDRALGDPVDVLVNHELVARGEVVVIDDHFGVRITELLEREQGTS